MAFKLGNFAVREVLRAVASDFNENMLYTLDEINNASIEISSESTDITDHRGNIIRTIYRSKTGTFTAENALLSPVVMNASSGSDVEYASSTNKIAMPKIITVTAGATQSVADAKEGTIKVMGLYNNGANGAVLTQSTSAVVDTTFAYDDSAKTITLPGTAEDAPTKYLVKYDVDEESGLKLTNRADVFPNAVRMLLQAAIMDPCRDKPRAGYILLPSFTPSPEMTLSLDPEGQTIEFTGSINVDYCGNDKVLYYIYFPDQDLVVSGGN